MRRNIDLKSFRTVLGVVLGAMGSWSFAGGMIADGGFENGAGGWSVPSGMWKIEDGAGYEGTKGLVWTCDDPDSYVYSTWRFAAKPGVAYRIGALVKIDRLAHGTAQFGLEWKDRNGKWLAGSYAHPVDDNGALKDGWTRYECVTSVMPPDVGEAGLNCVMTQKSVGRVRYDEVSIEEVEIAPVEFVVSSAIRGRASAGRVRFAARIHADPAVHAAVLSFTGADGRPKSVPPAEFDANAATFDLAVKDMSLGRQTVRVELKERAGGKALGSGTCDFVRTASADRHRVTFDDRRRMFVDGKPFFPLGNYVSAPTEETARLYGKGPFNFAVQYGDVKAKDLDLWQKAGVFVAADVRRLVYGYSYARLKSSLRTLEDSKAAFDRKLGEIGGHPALLMWYLNDEAPVELAKNTADIHGLLHEVDPDRATLICLDKPQTALDFLQTFDALAHDCYPLGNREGRHTLDRVFESVRETDSNMHGMRPLWFIPQAFDWKWYRGKEEWDLCDRGNMRMPTRKELANMTWQGIAGGANGVVFFSFETLLRNLKGAEFDRAWDDVCGVAGEVRKMESVLLSDGAGMPVGDVPGELAVRTYNRKGRDWALVVNRTDRPVKAMLSLPRSFTGAKAALGAGVSVDGQSLLVDLPALGTAFVGFEPVSSSAVIAWHGSRGTVAELREDCEAFADESARISGIAQELLGQSFLRAPADGCTFDVLSDGEITVLVPDVPDGSPDGVQHVAERYDLWPSYLRKQGFSDVLEKAARVSVGREHETFRALRKIVKRGERMSFRRYSIVVGFDPKSSKSVPVPVLTLPNGITMPEDPRERTDFRKCAPKTPPIPYLENPPETIDVTVGRQLFVDDFLIASSTMKRIWEKPRRDPANPVLKPETDFERGVGTKYNPMAAPISGGVWYDGTAKRFRCYYRGCWYRSEAYAESDDGHVWRRPELKVEKGTNRVLPLPKEYPAAPDSSAVIMDPDAADGYRWKAFTWYRYWSKTLPRLYVSKNGVDWVEGAVAAYTGDRSTIFYNPFIRRWVYSCRASWLGAGKSGSGARCRNYSESADFLGGRFFMDRTAWLYADDRELPENVFFYPDPGRSGKFRKPDLYNFDAVAYESVMLGVETLFPGCENAEYEKVGLPKPTDLHLAFSRNGFDFSRPEDRTPFLACTRKVGDWECGYLHSNAGICTVVGDELWFFYTGFKGMPERTESAFDLYLANGIYANGAMGIAKLRRDGFCSLSDGVLETRRMVSRKGDRLWVNAAASEGALEVSVCDHSGRNFGTRTISGTDGTRLEVGVLESGKPFRLRFKATGGARLYSFWTSDASGGSGGYLAAGSPGRMTLRDE